MPLTADMGSDSGDHVPDGIELGVIPEEGPVHHVSVDGFWIDRTPVTNAEFARFVAETGHVSTAEVPPKAEDYPGALPEMLYAGSLVFVKPSGPAKHGSCGTMWLVRCGDLLRARRPRSKIARNIRSSM